MPKPFRKMTIGEFTVALDRFTWRTKKHRVHLHHTWLPNHKTFRKHGGLKSVQGMHYYHTTAQYNDKGKKIKDAWDDIAQHITIDPEGVLWTGRDWNKTPVSARPDKKKNIVHNKPDIFMIEMIGNFDHEKSKPSDPDVDKFSGAQKRAAVLAVAVLQEYFKMNAWYGLRFHNQLTYDGGKTPKTCPGTIDRAVFVSEVLAARKKAVSGNLVKQAYDANRAGLPRIDKILSQLTSGDPTDRPIQQDLVHDEAYAQAMMKLFPQ